ncbi:hypothetical protein [Methylobacterium nigriterrae]|uniref:hypothetical protein n=1 Tax=Methylobacterium nigriterrae TaxID=3127512 RepID=UPI00301405E2
MAEPPSSPISSLDVEKATLIKADQDIADGERRITEQIDRIEELRADGRDTARSEELLATFKDTLAEWYAHREQILRRINDLRNR